PSFSLNITRERVPDLETTVALLQSLLELDDEDINQLHRRLGQRRRPFEAVPVMFNLTEDQIARIAVNQFRLPGIEVQARFVRHYLAAEHFAHAVGYVSRINEREMETIDRVAHPGTNYIGQTGLERLAEQLL